MDAERWRRIGELYHAALTRAQDERTVFLAEACAGDEALQRDVELLLAQQSEGFLDGPAVSLALHGISDASGSILSGRRTLSVKRACWPR